MGVSIVFVDVDGVLNNQFTTESCDGFIGIDDKYVANLRKIVDSTEDCRIVLSSTWRLGFTRYGDSLEHHREYLDNKLAKQGLKIFDVTPDLSRNGESRGCEIHTWLEEHEDLGIDFWVVLDDEYFYDFGYYDVSPHWVATDFYSENGSLNDKMTQEAIEILHGGVASDFR